MLRKRNTANHADNFAPLVDREAWGIGRAARLMRKEFYVVKLVSDRPTEKVEAICQVVKENAEEWSDQLFRWFCDFQADGDDFFLKDDEVWQWPELYFTTATERQLGHLLKALKHKGWTREEIERESSLAEICDLSLRKKEKGKLFIQALQKLLNPVLNKIQDELEQCSESLTQSGFKVKFDPDLEGEQIHLSTTIQNPAQINKLLTGLESFSHQKFLSIMRQDRDHQ